MLLNSSVMLHIAITSSFSSLHSQETKRHVLLGRKVIANLVSILKSRDITLLLKVHMVKAMVFPVLMDRCEIWTIKKAEH